MMQAPLTRWVYHIVMKDGALGLVADLAIPHPAALARACRAPVPAALMPPGAGVRAALRVRLGLRRLDDDRLPVVLRGPALAQAVWDYFHPDASTGSSELEAALENEAPLELAG